MRPVIAAGRPADRRDGRMGRFLLDGLTGPLTPDVNTVQAWLVITAAIVVLFNLLADIMYAALDPRIRYG